jgi:hypothetical protein
MPLTTNKKELRKFGLVMAGAFLLLAAYLWYREITNPWWIGSIGGAFLGLGLLVPIALAPIEFVWMKIAHVMGFVMTRVILTLVFFLAITPTGLVFRLLGKDLLQKKIDPKADTYWIPAEPDGPWTRPDKPF